MPGPAPFDRPAFPAEFLEKCRSLVRRRTVPLAQYQRARLALLSTNHRAYPTSQLVPSWNCIPIPYASGVTAGHKATFLWSIKQDAGESPLFPPRDHAIVKAIACEAVCQTQLPLSRLSSTDLAARASTAIGRVISPSTVWRILDADAIKPWRYEYWIFPRDPRFAEKAGRVLDLYDGSWESKPLGRKDYIISSDEKTSIQARVRCHPTFPTGPRRPMRVETRVRARRSFAVLGRLGRPAWTSHGPMRGPDRDRILRPTG